MTDVKMTKREMFELIKGIVAGEDVDVDVSTVTEFCDKEIAALDTKAAKARERAAAKRAEGDALKELVADALTEKLQTIADITVKVTETDADATAGKVGYRLRALENEGVAVKEKVKIKSETGTREVVAYRLAE